MKRKLSKIPYSSVSQWAEKIRAGDRGAIARAITYIESKNPLHSQLARELLQNLQLDGRPVHRIGIGGPPGAGKSTLIDALGLKAVESGKKLAVLALDPSSAVGKGSILGDKTRMNSLSTHPQAFIRPSPSWGGGGVHPKLRELFAIFEAAQFDWILVETVGIGQSETAIASLVDTVVLVVLPNSGDELQGIKRGILEVTHIIAVNKADGPFLKEAQRTKRQLESALSYSMFQPGAADWTVPVTLVSAKEQTGISELFGEIERHWSFLHRTGLFRQMRRKQRKEWFRESLKESFFSILERSSHYRKKLENLELEIEEGKISPVSAAELFVSSIIKTPKSEE